MISYSIHFLCYLLGVVISSLPSLPKLERTSASFRGYQLDHAVLLVFFDLNLTCWSVDMLFRKAASSRAFSSSVEWINGVE
jgi:hypothetical protein